MPPKKRCGKGVKHKTLRQLLKDVPCRNCKRPESEHEGTSFGELVCPGVFYHGTRVDPKDQRNWDEISYAELDNLEILEFYDRQ